MRAFIIPFLLVSFYLFFSIHAYLPPLASFPFLPHIGIFEFCINAEKVGARKRTGRPYAAAVKQAGVGEGVEGRWVHVGDDFTEDIVVGRE